MASSSASQADALRRRADEHRGQDAFLDALAQAGLELGVGDLLAVEVLDQDVVVGLGGGLEELVAAHRDLVGELVGDRDLDFVRAVPLVGLAMDEVDVAARTTRPLRSPSGAARSCRRRSPAARRGPRSGRRSRGRDLLMKKHAAVPLARPRATACSSPASTPAEASMTNEGAVGRREALDHVGHEVRVAGRVDERDPGPVVLERPDRQAQRLAPLLLLGLEVQVGACRRPRVPSRGIAPALNSSCSASVVLPAPAWPARTTLRRWGRSTLFIVIGPDGPPVEGLRPGAGRA